MSAPHRLANGDSAKYWDAAAEGRLALQKCRACGAVQFPPRHHCATCWDGELDWIDATGRGTVESFTIVRRAPLPAFRDRVPYVVAAVVLEEGPRMIASIRGEDALGAAIGDPVVVAFETDDAGAVLPIFHRDLA